MSLSKLSVFSTYMMSPVETRAGHALRTCHQFIIAITGSFDVVLDDGIEKQRFQLNRSYRGVYVPPLIWRELDNFSSGSVCAVLASECYDANGYYRTYDDFLTALKLGSTVE